LVKQVVLQSDIGTPMLAEQDAQLWHAVLPCVVRCCCSLCCCCRYEQVEAIRQELKAREQVEALYQQGKEAEAAAAAAAAAGNGAAADGSGQGPDDAKIADDEDAGAGHQQQGGWAGGGYWVGQLQWLHSSKADREMVQQQRTPSLQCWNSLLRDAGKAQADSSAQQCMWISCRMSNSGGCLHAGSCWLICFPAWHMSSVA
jgi:hypothetical protein